MRYKRGVQEFARDTTTDQAVHASEVPRIKGKRYQCYCTNGPHAVFVRKPKKRRAHFAHLSGVVVRADPNREVHDWTRDTLYRLIRARLGDAHLRLRLNGDVRSVDCLIRGICLNRLSAVVASALLISRRCGLIFRYTESPMISAR